MDDRPLEPMLANPCGDMVDANQLHHNELDNSLSLNSVSTQTAAAIALCSHQPTSKPNYRPSRATGLFSKGDENNAAVDLAPKASSTASAATHAVLSDITNSSGASNGLSAANDTDGFANSDPNLTSNASNDIAPEDGSSDTPAGPTMGGGMLASSASPAPVPDHGLSDTPMARNATGSTSSAVGATSTNGTLGTEPGGDPALSGTADGPVVDGVSGVAASTARNASGLTSAAGTTSTNGTSGLSGTADGPDAEALPPRKKKRLEMGAEERRVMRKAAQDRSEKLSADIDKLLEEQEELFAKYAQLNDVSVDRVKKLAHQLPSMKPQKKASNYNILVYFKGQELNSARAKGACIPLKELHDRVKGDDDLQDIFNDADAMKALRQKYNEEKAEEKITAVRVSKRAQAKSIAEKMNLLQQEADFMYESSDANSFGMVVRGSFKSTVVSGFYGRGPADAFFRTHFCMGVQDVLNLYESFVVTAEKMGTRKLYQSEMASEIVRLITQGLQEVTGIVNLSMQLILPA
ncbi:hypothetical protein BT96DRAFT_1008478 [Gymnopus androsaceus JB14]|uniref:Uncharacterized protein n=1 Tax=Gymnopus androsaceus JB14 TaxID=1447944 RepID=A0A6A4GF43_9AGAR|nr:hypothetical protein BT96DRAFT_1008478 [Gymnopus androsaceus JB14]